LTVVWRQSPGSGVGETHSRLPWSSTSGRDPQHVRVGDAEDALPLLDPVALRDELLDHLRVRRHRVDDHPALRGAHRALLDLIVELGELLLLELERLLLGLQARVRLLGRQTFFRLDALEPAPGLLELRLELALRARVGVFLE
jgi:hypothetical protein